MGSTPKRCAARVKVIQHVSQNFLFTFIIAFSFLFIFFFFRSSSAVAAPSTPPPFHMILILTFGGPVMMMVVVSTTVRIIFKTWLLHKPLQNLHMNAAHIVILIIMHSILYARQFARKNMYLQLLCCYMGTGGRNEENMSTPTREKQHNSRD